MFGCRKIANYAAKLDRKLKLGETPNNLSDQNIKPDTPLGDIKLDHLVEQPSGGENESLKADMDNHGVPIKTLVDYISEKEKRWSKDKILQDIKDCISSDIGFLEKTNRTHWKYEDYVRVSKRGRDAKGWFWGRLYCFELFVKQYGETKTIILTIILSGIFWLFAKDIYNSIASVIHWPRI